MGATLSPMMQRLLRIWEYVEIERWVPPARGYVGRPPLGRMALARAFVAKAVLGLTPDASAGHLDQILRQTKTCRQMIRFLPLQSIKIALKLSKAQHPRPQSRRIKLSNIVLNLVQNSCKANPKQRALADFLGLVDQFLQFPDHTPVA